MIKGIDALFALAFCAAIAVACAPAQTPAPTAAPPSTAPSAASTSLAITPTARPTTSTASAPTAAPTPRVVNFDQLKLNVDAAMSAFMKENNVIGCSVAVVYPDAANKLETHSLNYGTLSKDISTPVDSTTQYEIASLSKLFTADILMLLVRDGFMQLDDPLQKYIPSNVHAPTYNGQAITLRDLATHTSGLPRGVETIPGVRTKNGVIVTGYYTQEEIFNFLNGYQLKRAPGSQWEYSNLAFALLGIAEEKAYGASYESLVVQRIDEVLGLPNTRANLSPTEKTKLAQGYFENGNAAPAFATDGAGVAMGGLRSTIQDLGRYLAANVDPGATKLDSVLSMTLQKQSKWSNQNMTAGLGWNIMFPGTPREQLVKAGETAGYNSQIQFSKANRTGYVVICNGHNVVEKAAPQLAKALALAESQLDENK